MFTGLTVIMAQEKTRELRAAAAEARLERKRHTPVTRVTLRHAVAGDGPRLRDLAELDSASPPRGSALVAEVDGRLRAALPLDGGCAIADPFYEGHQLLELLRLRASHLEHR